MLVRKRLIVRQNDSVSPRTYSKTASFALSARSISVRLMSVDESRACKLVPGEIFVHLACSAKNNLSIRLRRSFGTSVLTSSIFSLRILSSVCLSVDSLEGRSQKTLRKDSPTDLLND